MDAVEINGGEVENTIRENTISTGYPLTCKYFFWNELAHKEQLDRRSGIIHIYRLQMAKLEDILC